MDKTIQFINLYKELHNSNKNYGNGSMYSKQHVTLTDIVHKTNSKNLLDYGCGKAQFYTEKIYNDLGCVPSLYDPAIEEYNTLPNTMFDGIFSIDVMEHIPEEGIPNVFNYMQSHATKFIYLAICQRLARAILPNGENAHCTIKPRQWWIEMLNMCPSTKKVYTIINFMDYERVEENGILELFKGEK
tara:strand:+ start:115 stop:675 length:561 start_codon:yes stop_codon:yes gene_type:complete